MTFRELFAGMADAFEQEARRARLQLPTIGRFGLAVMLLTAFGWYVYVRNHRTPIAAVNGIYRNACCKPVKLKDGLMIFEGTRVPFELDDMKFGLTAYPTRNVVVSDNQVRVAGGKPPAILFSKDRKTLTLCPPLSCSPEYRFVRN